MLKAYAIGFVGAVLAIVLVAGIWLLARPSPEPGLSWGSTVYTSKQEFQGYLKAKGLSYKMWVARNPGAAPWEPDPKSARATQPVPKEQAGEDWSSRLPLTTIGLMLAAGCAILLFLLGARSVLPTVTQRSSAASGQRAVHVDRIRRLGVFASGATRRLKVSAPVRTERLDDKADARLVPRLMRERNINGGDVVFGLITVVAAGALGLFVVLLASA